MYILSIITREMGKLKTHSPLYCIMDEKICSILLTHSTKYIWQAFYKFNVFRWVCTKMIMGWCNVQTNEHDLQAKTYTTICTHHELHNNIEHKTPSRLFRNIYAISDRIWCNKHLRHTITEKYDNNGSGWYFRFDDNNNISYGYILLIT